MSNYQSTNLCGADEMLAKLMEVDRWPGVVNVLYPKLLEAAGRTLNSHGIVLCLLDAFSLVEQKYVAGVALPLHGMVPQFIDAMIEDAAVAAEAKAWYAEVHDEFMAQEPA